MKPESWLDSCDAHMLKSAGVYAILNEDEEVIYVGETYNFITRWGWHCDPGQRRTVPLGEIFQFIVLAYEDNRDSRLDLEKAYQRQLQPKYNGLSNHGPMFRVETGMDPYKLRDLNKILRRKRMGAFS